MIKVLKDGRNKEFFAVCPGCYSEMTYQREDTSINDVGRDYIGTPIKRRYIICPICGREFLVTLDESRVVHE